MKTMKKITILLMTSILFFLSIFSIFPTQKVQAITEIPNQADLFSEGEVVYFNYDGIGIGVEVIQYKLFGVNQPVYCLNKGRPGVTKDHTYSVKLEEVLNDMKVWRAIINGYPFKSEKELGCETVYEAYAATKMAVYDTMYHYDLSKFTPHDANNPAHVRTVNAIKKIITAARNSTDSKIAAVAKIKAKNEEWKVDEYDKNYVSKTYYLETSASNLTFEVELAGEGNKQAILTDILDQKRSSFNGGEEFKIKIPIKDLDEGGTFDIKVKTDLRTFPILYGESPNPDWQNFAVTVGYYEPTTATLQETYYPNKTEIEINKQDGDTKEPLQNASFQILDEKHNIVFSEVNTNEEGKAILKDFIPGTYYIKEMKTPEGYYGYEKEIEITVKLNEKCVITVDNFALPEEENEPKPQEENHVSASEKQEIKTLPRTGC